MGSRDCGSVRRGALVALLFAGLWSCDGGDGAQDPSTDVVPGGAATSTAQEWGARLAELGTAQGPGLLDDDLPVPAPLPERGLLRTADGLLEHAPGARLMRAGQVIEGEVVRYSSRLRNASDAALKLQRIEGECECVEVFCYRLDGDQRVGELWPGDAVAADEEFEVQVHLDTSDRSGELQLEGILAYAGGARPLKFGILTDVLGIYALDPPTGLVAENVLLGSPSVQRVRITSPIAPRFKLSCDTSALPGYLDFSVQPVDVDGRGYATAYDCVFRVGAAAPDSPLVRTRPLRLDVEVAPSIEQPLPLTYTRNVDVGYRTQLPVEFVQILRQESGDTSVGSGSALYFGIVPAGETVERALVLRVRDGEWDCEEDPAVTLVGESMLGSSTMPEGSLSWAWERTNRGARRLVVTLENPDDGAIGPLKAQLEVALGHPQVPTLTVGLGGILR
ncbi:hypothetical protein Pla163_25510 [Planctomycetes bacterium Pla163]|uniref:DUF1573 domain-containing protein n=1 Tax=Rohdeia mirabilis TaxID=2528008 RepID=A0A518D1S4_9BACT|nr:hypothetical protein Pla163_25510 [Planctomycetes bacterium Pla163]